MLSDWRKKLLPLKHLLRKKNKKESQKKSPNNWKLRARLRQSRKDLKLRRMKRRKQRKKRD
jgi:hypothetical protein